MNRRDAFDSLNFHDHLVLHDQISEKSGVDADLLVDHRDALLASDAQPAFFQLVGQGRLLDRLQQSRTEPGVHAKGCIDDLLSHGILVHCDPV